MKKLITILALGLTLFSCKKEDIEPTNPTPTQLVNNDTLVLTCNNFGNQWVEIHYTSMSGEQKIVEYILDNTDSFYTGTTTNSIFKFPLADVNMDSTFYLSSDFYFQGVNEVYMYYNIYINDSLIASPSVPGDHSYLEFYLNY